MAGFSPLAPIQTGDRLLSHLPSEASVLFVDQAGELGGAELSLLDIVRLRPRPSSVVLFAEGPFRSRLAEVGVPVVVIPFDGSRRITRGSGVGDALLAAPDLARVILTLAGRARKSDLIYANTQKAFIIAACAAILVRRPLIWHLRDILTSDHFAGAMRTMAVGLANRTAACIIANSQATANAFYVAGGTADVRVIHNGIDCTPFDSIDADQARTSLRAELGLMDQRIVGVFSRLAEWKGQHVLIDALRALPNLHAILVGGALFEEHAYEEKLRHQVNALGLSGRCHFLGFRSDVPRLMKAVDVVVHTSIAPEPFGRVVVEGMLAGRPVVATRAGGVSEIINDGETGFLVTPGSVDELASTIGRLVASRDLSRTIGEASQLAARQRFSLAGSVAAINAVIDETSRPRKHT
ncbi:glycosyltransferase family 4 protein [Xanthobacter dioxanivorans]|uniref:Glycosyltransferase family 4 protein n=1 Tax=Xanthobacter dioxanivorans TaxID=2528964 RepID=A0A974PU95_9HYPH|nr:glycosyltransferase family 4 protein [Xanthobacter dioxanivorans]